MSQKLPGNHAAAPTGITPRIIRCESYVEQLTGDLITVDTYDNGKVKRERVKAKDLRERHRTADWAV